jgi:NAD(P)-dependent dehydrogenase (short-subunit alcohol dehydrogenase family)
VVTVRADVRDLAALRAAVADVLRAFGRIDVLAANAGINAPVPLLHARDDEFTRHWRNLLDVNVLGVANAMRAVLPHMTARRRGRIVATTSTFGRQGNAANPNYVASKWAVIGLVKSAAIEAGPFGVTVNAIAPTAVRTGLGGPQTARSAPPATSGSGPTTTPCRWASWSRRTSRTRRCSSPRPARGTSPDR